MYYQIDENTARLAHQMMSMSDYPEGRATREYRAAVDKAAALVEQKKQQLSSFYHEKLDALLDRYARRLAEWTNAYNRNGASCPSVLVSGAGNFPMRKKARQNAREESLWAERQEIDSLLDKIKSTGTGPIDLADPHAREMLEDRIQSIQAEIEKGKALNAWMRKHHTFSGFPGLSEEQAEKMDRDFADLVKRCPFHSKPYPDFELASLRGKLKRVQDRLAELKSKQSTGNEEEAHDGFTIVRNVDLNRLQILFDGIPDDATRAALKSHAFRWSPKNKAWQRQLTKAAEDAAKAVLGL